MDHLAINEFDLCFKLLKNTEKLLLSKEEAERVLAIRNELQLMDH